jgi:protein O-GlcNAc transferase
MISQDDTADLRTALFLHRGGQVDRAANIYRKVLAHNPDNSDALHYLGLVEAGAGSFERANSLIARSLELQPSNTKFRENYATVLCQAGRYDLAIKTCDEGLRSTPRSVYLLYISATALFKLRRLPESLQRFDKLLVVRPDHPVAINERGSVLAGMKEYDQALAAFQKAVTLNPKFADAHLNLGNLFGELERHEEAKSSFEKALALNPRLAPAWSGLGVILRKEKLFDEALAAFEKALALDLHLTEAWLGRGNVFADLKWYESAFAAYDKALLIEPGLAGACLGRGNAFRNLKRYDEALNAYDRALSLDPLLSEAWLGRGNVYFELKQYDDALTAYDHALTSKPDLAEAWFGRGNVYNAVRLFDDALTAYDRALSLRPDLKYATGGRLHAKMHLCDWAKIEGEIQHVLSAVRDRKAVSEPFNLLSIPSSSADQLQCAKSFVSDQRSFSALCREIYSHDRIRVAYLSADFRNHAVAYLVTGLFEHHDKSRFEITGISFGPAEDSTLRRRLETAFEHFIDTEDKTDEDIANLIRYHEIDIAVDLMGHTQNSRLGILARRPAPIQVQYIGYAGTLGTDYIDYILADSTVVPEEHRPFFTEQVVWLPDSYLVSDDRRSISPHTPMRHECGLPEDAFVFCSFNNSYKITPVIFELWMRVLRAIPKSVLWLSQANAIATANLRREVERHGVSPQRLIFAPRVSDNADHLARQRQADLFLDTLPYNAHTTASDALWAGVPVLTCLGETFAGRVAASLLRAIGLPELVTTSLADYETLALKLAREPPFLAAIKAQLARNRETYPLFDTARFTRHIEAAYTTMWQRYQSGEAPTAFTTRRIDQA